MIFRTLLYATYAGIAFAIVSGVSAKPDPSRSVAQAKSDIKLVQPAQAGFIARQEPFINPYLKKDVKPFEKPATKNVQEVLKKYGDDIKRAAHTYDFNPQEIAAVLLVESRGNPYAISETGARGCMQVLPSTERMIGLTGDIFDCQYAIYVGARYLAYIRDTYKFDRMDKVFAAYHDGPERVARYSREDFYDHPYLESIRNAINEVPKPQYW